MSLLDSIAEAQLVVADQAQRLVYAWFGGAGVNIYDEDGREVDYFTIGSTSRLSPERVRAAIERMIERESEP